MSTQLTISIVLPTFNESEALPDVVSTLLKVLESQSVHAEIVVVDDGSTDATREVVQALQARYGALRYIRFSRNFGKEAALSAGLDTATGHAVVLMDSDGQHPASLLPTFIEKWRAGAEVVCALQTRRPETRLRLWTKSVYYTLLSGGSRVSIQANAGDFRLLDRKVVNAVKALPERNRFMKGLFAWVGFKTEYVEFEASPRLAGQSKFDWRGLFGLGLTGLTSFSVVPLRLVAICGLIISTASLLYGLFLVLSHYIDGTHLPGWATIVVGMLFLSGLQLLALGIIAEYLGRTFNEVKQRPLYIVAEDTGAHVRDLSAQPVSQEAVAHDVDRR